MPSAELEKEDEEALDRPPDPAASWQRTTVEEIVLEERARLAGWKANNSRYIRRELGLAPMRDVLRAVDSWTRFREGTESPASS